MSNQAQQFPGVYFDVVQPQVEDSLPRMDIASFVGYASSGPIDTPVPVEDSAQFREIFGADINLAWNIEQNRTEKSNLGMSVEAFFRNGGRRCWIVRVADETLAKTAFFTLPGLISVNDSSAQKVTAPVRSPGSWAQYLQLNTALQVIQMPFVNQDGAQEPYLSVSSSGWFVNVLANETQTQQGDMVSVRIDEYSILYLIVSDIKSTSAGIRISGERAFLSVDDTDVSPTAFDADYALTSDSELDNITVFPSVHFDEMGLSQEWSATTDSPEQLLTSAQLLHFEILCNDNRTTSWRISELGFTAQRHRFWGYLPSDQTLFRSTEGRVAKSPSVATQQLLDEVTSPRFPLASGFSETADTHEQIYLPIGMSVFTNSEHIAAAQFEEDSDSLSINGIDNSGSAIFVDDRLARMGSRVLYKEGYSIAYLSESSTPLKGIHSLLTVEEATLIAVPDAVHRRWHDIVNPPELSLAAPELTTIDKDAGENEYRVEWLPVSEATQYTLEWSEDPDFSTKTSVAILGNPLPAVGDAVNLSPEPDTEYYLWFNKQCPRTIYFRVRSENRNEVSVWSNNLAEHIPESDFLDCDSARAQSLALELSMDSVITSPSSPETDDGEAVVLLIESAYFELQGMLSVDESSFDQIEIQKSNELSFIRFEQPFFDHPSELDSNFYNTLQWFINNQTDSLSYYRVRAYRRGTKGPWSNTVMVFPTRLSRSSLHHQSEFVDEDLLAVHRALLRLCFARQDLFGALSLPSHYTTTQAQEHFSRLSPAQTYDSVLSLSDPLSAKVYPLTVGEIGVCSHGALYYPWLASKTESDGRGSIRIRSIPPDGSVLGKMAGKSIEQGAWVAPANSAMVDVLALETNVTSAQWASLMRSHINVVREDASGFALLSADTLSDNSEFKEINVRRLMSMLKRLVLREGNRYVFEPNSAAFQERVQLHFETLFDNLYARGAFAGNSAAQAFRVNTDANVNTEHSIDTGRFIVELQVAPSHPLKFIRVRLVQSGPNQLRVQEVSG